MAEGARKRSGNRRSSGYAHSVYVDGNTVRRLQAVPAQREYEQRRRAVSKNAKRNRERATSMGAGFVAFLALMCIAVLFSCVNYLQMKSELTKRERSLARLETEYSQLKAENDAYYSQVVSSVDMENIKKIATERLGMKYATDDQKISYETERSSYVRQYQDVPGLDR